MSSEEKKDIFKTNIFSYPIEPPNHAICEIKKSHLPSNQELYFFSKWHEIYERYCSARIFLREALNDDWEYWKYWFKPTDDYNIDLHSKLIFVANFFETALINYNILVDLSWTITYVSIEYALYQLDPQGNIKDSANTYVMLPIEEASKLLRKLEKIVTSPTSNKNPFQYLNTIQPFPPIINLIINFWNDFSDNEIRSIYNYIKHQGKPIYSEIIKLYPNCFFSFKTQDKKSHSEQYPSAINDIQKKLNLYENIEKLLKFDDEKLFPYLCELIEKLRKVINPSQMII